MQVRWVMLRRAAELTGYSEEAIRHKIKRKVWSEGRHWKRAPDGRIAVNLDEYERWVEQAQ